MKTWALILDVFRQSRSSAMFWILIGLSVLVAAGLACVGFDADQMCILTMKIPGRVPVADQPSTVKTMLAGVDGSMLGWIGMILMVVATGNFWPGFLNRGWVLLTLSKPINRPAIFAGRIVGATLFVAFQASFFAVITLAAVGLRTGYWVVGHLAVVPIVVAIFLVIYSMSCLIGVLSRSTVFAILAALFFWVICSISNRLERMLDQMEQGPSAYQREDRGPQSRPETSPGVSVHYSSAGGAQTRPDSQIESPRKTTWGKAIHALYLVMPKTSDMDLLMKKAIYDGPPRSEGETLINRIQRQEAARVDYRTSLLTTTAIVLFLFGLALWRFYRADY